MISPWIATSIFILICCAVMAYYFLRDGRNKKWRLKVDKLNRISRWSDEALQETRELWIRAVTNMINEVLKQPEDITYYTAERLKALRVRLRNIREKKRRER